MAKTLLIVEDEPLVREALSEHLRERGYDVITAEDGEVGLKAFFEQRPSVVILDLIMPKLGGLGFLEGLKRRDTIEHSVIVLTGYGDDDDVARCYQLGVQAFLRKPVNLFELDGALRRSFDMVDYAIQLNREVEAREEAMRALERANRDLIRQHQLLHGVFETMGEGAAVLDDDFRIQMMSRKACRILGVSQDQVKTRSAAGVFGASVAGPNGVLLRRSDRATASSSVTVDLVNPQGRAIPVHLTMVPLMTAQQRGGWLLLFSEIRESAVPAGAFTFGKMVSSDPTMLQVFNVVEKVAVSRASVLVQGESGTGKELVAREIHQRSGRSGPFHAVNCAAISPHLMESEFFGHEKGAFTGAHRSKPGRFELAHQGTLFLDEVGEIPLELQGKLLRAIQEQCFERVGGTRKVTVDARILAATNRDLETLVAQGKFRDDLFFRLNVVPIRIPPLRARFQDVALLTRVFIEQLNHRESRIVRSVSSEALDALLAYSWPGNVRELFSAIEYAFALSKGAVLERKHFQGKLGDIHIDETAMDETHPDNERDLILTALRQAGFKKEKAAALLGIDRSTLYRKRKKYGI